MSGDNFVGCSRSAFDVGDAVPAVNGVEERPRPMLGLENILTVQECRGESSNNLNVPFNKVLIVSLGRGELMYEPILAEVGTHLAILEDSLRVRPERFDLVSEPLEMFDCTLKRLEK